MFVVARVYHVVAHNNDAVAVDCVEKRQRSVSVISFKFALSWDCFFGRSTARSWRCGKFCIAVCVVEVDVVTALVEMLWSLWAGCFPSQPRIVFCKVSCDTGRGTFAGILLRCFVPLIILSFALPTLSSFHSPEVLSRINVVTKQFGQASYLAPHLGMPPRSDPNASEASLEGCMCFEAFGTPRRPWETIVSLHMPQFALSN